MLIYYVERFGRNELDKIKTIDSIHIDRDDAYTTMREVRETDTDVSATYEVVPYDPIHSTWGEHLQARMLNDQQSLANMLTNRRSMDKPTVTKKSGKPVLRIVK